jgi:pimeloyl-ACP methyl ester carboxylesterase
LCYNERGDAFREVIRVIEQGFSSQLLWDNLGRILKRRRKCMSTFILVHGAWHGGWCYKRVAERLRAEGHVVYTPTNTGLGERSHLYHRDINLDTHITDILNVIRWEELDDFVLVGHSSGGMIITGVADRIPEKVRRLVYLDAFVPEDGKCQMDYMRPELVARMRADAAASDKGVRPILAEIFHVNEKDAAWLNRMCVNHPIHTFDQPLKQAGGIARLRNKRVFIWNEGYAGEAFTRLYDVLVSDKNWIVYKTPGGHDVMLDMPDELTRILLEVA